MADVIGTGAGTITSGQRTTAAIGASRKIPVYLQEMVYIAAEVAPLSALINKLGNKKTVGQNSYFHLETDMLPFTITDSGSGLSDVGTTLNVSAGQGARVTIGSLLKVLRTGEIIRVTNVVTDALTIVRHFGQSTGYAINASEEIAILSFADTEGNTSPSGQSSEPTLKTNYTQTFRQAFELSGRDINTEVYGDAELERIKRDALEGIMTKKEKAFLFQNGISATDPTMTGGLEHWITTNVTNVAGALSESTLNTFIQDWYRRNYNQSKSMVLFAGELFSKALDAFGRDAVRYAADDEILGIQSTGYKTAFGTVKVVRHGMMSKLGAEVTAANLGWQGYAMGVNLSLIGECVHRGRDMRLRPNIQTPDKDGTKWEYLMDCGLYVANERAHGVLKGITG